MPPPEFHIALIGDGGVGKRTFLKENVWCELLETRIVATPALGGAAVIRRLRFFSNRGPVIFNVWTHPQMFHAIDAGLFEPTCAIMMFDVTSRITYKNMPNWYRDFKRACGENFPVVIVGNRANDKDRKIKAKQLTFWKKKCPYFDISARTKYNCEKPFWSIYRMIANDDNMFFYSQEMLQTQIDTMYQQQILPLWNALGFPARQPPAIAVGFGTHCI